MHNLLKTEVENLEKISSVPIWKQVIDLEISSASLLPFLWLLCLSSVNQLQLQTLLSEFIKFLYMVLAGLRPRRKSVIEGKVSS